MTKENREGFPGEPGELGSATQGGRGGTGGKGGYGEKSHDRVIILLFIIVTVALSIGTAIALKHVEANTNRIAQLEKTDVQILQQADRARDAIAVALTKANKRQDQELTLIRETTYRLCLREQVTRAVLNSDKFSDEPRLPLYDCTPNLTGGVAKLLTSDQAKVFIAKEKNNGFNP
jgi:hypothetical protein